jgi:hypothetical protein
MHFCKSSDIHDLIDNMNNYIYHTIRQAAMSYGKIVDICATLPQTLMYMEFD